jgi:ribokinase
MKPKIVVVGSANTDMVVKVQHLPEPGETILGGDYIQAWGGKGANQAVAAARLGAEVTFVARLGMDAFGDGSVAAYKADGINTEYIIRDDKTPSGVALIMVNHGGENIIAVAQGANARLSPEDILAAENAIQGANCLLVQLEIPLETVQAAVQLAVKHHVPVILNPAPATKLPPALLEMVDFLTPNETEAAILEGEYSSSRSIDGAYSLKSKFKIKNLIITLGVKGAAIIGYRNQIVPPYTVQSVDTTGAGDAFNGALAVALARGDNVVEAVKFANAVAALTATGSGAQSSMPTVEAVEAFMKENQAR